MERNATDSSPDDEDRGVDPVLAGMEQKVTDPVLRGIVRDFVAGGSSAGDALDDARAYMDVHRVATADPDEVSRRVSFADGALGAEGLAVTDPDARDLARRVADGTMTGDEAVLFLAALVDSGALLSQDADRDPGYTVGSTPMLNELYAAVDAGTVSRAEASLRSREAFRVDRAFRRASGPEAFDAQLELVEPTLTALLLQIARGELSGEQALEAGLSHIATLA